MNKIIDISEHNGSIDFSKVKKDGVEGVIIRVGWIGNKQNHTIDKKFEEYYNLAKEQNLKIGFYVYSYCLTNFSILDGSLWLFKQIRNKSFELPVFLDLEDKTIKNLNKGELTNQVVTFCNYMQNLGYKAGVYASKDWFKNKIDVYSLENYKIWLAEWNGKDSPTVSYKVDLWQYTSKRKNKRYKRKC